MNARDRRPARPRNQWLTTWRRLLRETTFKTLDDLQMFLEAQGIHNGEIPTAEAFRRGIAKQHRGKFFWNLAKCLRLLKAHHHCSDLSEPRPG